MYPRPLAARNTAAAAAATAARGGATASYDAMLASSESASAAIITAGNANATIRPAAAPPCDHYNSGAARAARAAGRAAWTNWWFGDFIEAAYPIFDRDRATYAAAVVGAAAAGAVTVACNVKSSAYLPIPMSIVLANKPAAALAVYALQFIPPFAVELIRNVRA